MEALARRTTPLRLARPGLVLLLLAGAHAVQWRFLAHYPQPELFGDPAGYYRVGVRLHDAVAQWRGGGTLAAAFESVRGTFYLLGVGSVFASLEAWRPGDLAAFRGVFAAFNTLSVLGVFLLARRLSGGSFAAGLVAGAAWALHPSVSTQTGRLYPDPITGCGFVWASWLFAEAVQRRRAGWAVAAGLVFGTALLVRSQLLVYLLLVSGLALAGSAPWWRRGRDGRRLAAALALSLAPTLIAWGGITRAVGQRDDVIQLGNLTFRPAYLFGFWQFLDTDGWIGPYRLREEPYYQALAARAEATGDRELLRSRARQAAFTIGYVARRPLESTLMVLDNAYRLYDRPANDYKWDYPFPYTAQVGYQRGLVVLGVAGIAAFVAWQPAWAGAFLVPAALALLHGLVFPWPRYNQPAMPILTAAAAALVVRLVLDARGAAPAWATAGRLARIAGTGAALLVAGSLLRSPLPEPAAVLRAAGALALLGLPFAALGRLARPVPRAAALLGFAAVAIPFAAHSARDRLWHQVTTRLDRSTPGAVQQILLTPEALGRLRTASQAYVMLDLLLPRGEAGHLELEVSGVRVPGSALLHTMPRLREATAAGGRDRRGYPQWWALPFDPAWLPASAAEPLRLVVRSDGSAPTLLRGDRFSGQSDTYEGPSFGEWPRAVALKIEYDADYRIPERRPLDSAGTRSFVLPADGGAPRPVAGVHRIRIVTLDHNEGRLSWVSAPTPEADEVVLAFAAYTGEDGTARVRAGGGEWELPLGSQRDLVVRGTGGVACHHFVEVRGDKPFGTWALRLPNPEPGVPVDLEARFLTGMRHKPEYFVVDPDAWPLVPDGLDPACAPGDGAAWVRGAVRLVDATGNNYPEDTGRWSVDRVF